MKKKKNFAVVPNAVSHIRTILINTAELKFIIKKYRNLNYEIINFYS